LVLKGEKKRPEERQWDLVLWYKAAINLRFLLTAAWDLNNLLGFMVCLFL
jgi:hypothetical protein